MDIYWPDPYSAGLVRAQFGSREHNTGRGARNGGPLSQSRVAPNLDSSWRPVCEGDGSTRRAICALTAVLPVLLFDYLLTYLLNLT